MCMTGCHYLAVDRHPQDSAGWEWLLRDHVSSNSTSNRSVTIDNSRMDSGPFSGTPDIPLMPRPQGAVQADLIFEIKGEPLAVIKHMHSSSVCSCGRGHIANRASWPVKLASRHFDRPSVRDERYTVVWE